MDKDIKLLFGKILGEIYRIQQASDNISCPSSSAQIYALLNGFEHAVDEEIESMGSISEGHLKAVIDVLEPILKDKKKLNNFKGFYDIEEDLARRGVDRTDAIHILTYFKANDQFLEIIEKMDTSNSPSECRLFEFNQWN